MLKTAAPVVFFLFRDKELKLGRILKLNHEFNRVYRKGKHRNGLGMSLYWFKRAGEGRRVGFAVSRKIRKAVRRNRVKRVLREIYRTNQDKIRDDIDLIVLGRTEALPGTYQELEKSFLSLLKQSGLWKPDEQKP